MSDSLECGSLSDVKHGLYDGLVSQGMSMKEMLRTPFRRIHMLMNNLSLITLHMPRLKSKNIVRILAVEQEGMIRTFAWHIDNQINIDV